MTRSSPVSLGVRGAGVLALRRAVRRWLLLLAVAASLAGCGSSTQSEEPAESQWWEVFGVKYRQNRKDDGLDLMVDTTSREGDACFAYFFVDFVDEPVVPDM